MKALVIDDDPVSRMVLAHLLGGFAALEVVEAESGQAAWQMMEDGLRPSICCCDMRMPGLSGLELLQRMKSTPELAEIPVVLVSAETEAPGIQHALKCGAAAYLRKPLNAAEARERLAGLLEKALLAFVETPVATMERLRIDAPRLAAYLSAYEGQVREQTEQLASLLHGGGQGEVKARIAGLQKGSQTLGLWRAADSLAQLARGEIDAQNLRETLARVSSAAAAQAKVVKGGLPA